MATCTQFRGVTVRDDLRQLIESCGMVVAPLLGGVVDYLNQVQSKQKAHSVMNAATHISSALFFGWLTGTVALELGYSVNMVSAFGGLGGYLGVRAVNTLLAVIRLRFVG